MHDARRQAAASVTLRAAGLHAEPGPVRPRAASYHDGTASGATIARSVDAAGRRRSQARRRPRPCASAPTRADHVPPRRAPGRARPGPRPAARGSWRRRAERAREAIPSRVPPPTTPGVRQAPRESLAGISTARRCGAAGLSNMCVCEPTSPAPSVKRTATDLHCGTPGQFGQAILFRVHKKLLAMGKKAAYLSSMPSQTPYPIKNGKSRTSRLLTKYKARLVVPCCWAGGMTSNGSNTHHSLVECSSSNGLRPRSLDFGRLGASSSGRISSPSITAPSVRVAAGFWAAGGSEKGP